MSALVATVLCKRRVTRKQLGLAEGNVEEFEYAIGDFEVSIESPGEYTPEELAEHRAALDDEFDEHREPRDARGPRRGRSRHERVGVGLALRVRVRTAR